MSDINSMIAGLIVTDSKTVSKHALIEALRMIESYQLDIRNAEHSTGVDLLKLGFCQGTIYKKWPDEITNKLF